MPGGGGGGGSGIVGGPPESRGGRSPQVDHAALAQEELRRQQEAVGAILDDFKATVLDPISAAVPGLVLIYQGFAFKDREGQEWKITPFSYSEDGRLNSANINGRMEVPDSRGRKVTILPRFSLNRGYKPPLTDSLSSLNQGTELDDIKFVADKMRELLAPAKAAQAATPQIPDYPAKAYRAPEGHVVVEIPGIPSADGDGSLIPIDLDDLKS